MALHPIAEQMLTEAKRAGGGKICVDWSLSVEERRRRTEESFAGNGRTRAAIQGTEDIGIPATWGQIPARIYRPLGKQKEKTPALLYLHGGGFFMGSIRQYDVLVSEICNATGRVCVSIEYRLAPEYKHPAALNDCVTAAMWLYGNAEQLGIDSERIAVIGDSAGGALSATTSQYLRDLGGFQFEKQILMYPTTDFIFPETESMKENDAYAMMNKEFVLYANSLYLAGVDFNAPYLFAARGRDLTHLPEAYIMTGEYDVLRDEAELYGERLKEAGNSVRIKRYPRMMHTFMLNTHLFEEARQGLRDISEFLK